MRAQVPPWRHQALRPDPARADAGAPKLRTSAMIASLGADGLPTRPAPFGHALAEIARTRDDVLGLTADLAKYTDLHVFAAAHPDRFIQVGMAEQALISVAAGLAREGFTPFATTYAVFASRRAYDFICMQVVEEELPVKLICALPGLTTGYGPSHQATEDLAIMRAMPGMTVIDPCDAVEIAEATAAAAAHPGPIYMRLLRGHVPVALEGRSDRFEIGKARMLRRGGDALVISSGLMTLRALEAAEALAADGIGLAVLHVATLKPLDRDAILAAAAGPWRLVATAENHSIVGGLGEAVGALLLEEGVAPRRFRRVALPDQFLDAGALPTLHDRYGVSTAALVRRIKGWLE